MTRSCRAAQLKLCRPLLTRPGVNRKHAEYRTWAKTKTRHRDSTDGEELPKFPQSVPPFFCRVCSVTLHRPSNVDDESSFLPMLRVLDSLSECLPLVFPVHPRTRQKWSAELELCSPTLRVIAPLGYLEFLALQKNAKVVITDSGGIQEETTYLGTRCLTLRENTERPITLTLGTNVLIGKDWDLLRTQFHESLKGAHKETGRLPLWDGKASERIAEILFAQLHHQDPSTRYGNLERGNKLNEATSTRGNLVRALS